LINSQARMPVSHYFFGAYIVSKFCFEVSREILFASAFFMIQPEKVAADTDVPLTIYEPLL